MGLYLDTSGNASLGVAICARCSLKFPIGELESDPNYPGLRVCAEDRDRLDPYRLPPRLPEDIVLEYPRPDTPIGVYSPAPNTPDWPIDINSP